MNGFCKSCGTQLQGVYCHVCGEKRITQKDKSLLNWLKEAFSNFVQLDGKVFKSLIALFIRPGKMAFDYFEGRRKPYLRMVNLFLIANLLYFLLPTFDTFKSNLYVQMNLQVYSGLVTDVVNDYMVEYSMDQDTFRNLYDAKTSEVSKLILILLAPIYGCFIYLLYHKKTYLTDGFNLALQLWSAFIILCIMPFSLLLNVIAKWWPNSVIYQFFAPDATLSTLMVIFISIYLWFLLRWLKENVWIRVLKILVLIFCLPPVFVLYRLLLFFATIWAI